MELFQYSSPIWDAHYFPGANCSLLVSGSPGIFARFFVASVFLVKSVGLPQHDTSAWLYDLRCSTRRFIPGWDFQRSQQKELMTWVFPFPWFGSASLGSLIQWLLQKKKTYVTWFGLHPPIFATNNQGQLVTAKSIENPPMTSQRMPPGCWWSSSNTTEVNLCDGLGTKRICFFSFTNCKVHFPRVFQVSIWGVNHFEPNHKPKKFWCHRIFSQLQ